jgi:DNA polymerase III delta prime subunit
VSMFQKAQKQQLKARVAFVGPTGSGKTWTALEWARTLVGPTGRIAVVDTENSSAAYYSDRFDFDVAPVGEPYEPHRLTAIIKEAAKEGYDAIVVDSLSHFWEGEGGVLDIADAAGQRSGGNSFAGWKTATPQLRNLIDVLRSVDMHVIVTMRSKMEWVLEKDERTGKTSPKKIGMAPVMRQGVEYEFTAVVDMDLEHRGAVTKSRCSEIADVIMQPHRAGETAEVFGRWLDSGEKLAPRDDVDALIGLLNGIDDPAARKAAKTELVEKYGPPDRLTAERYPAALDWARGFTVGISAPPPPEPEPAPEPEQVEQPKLVEAPKGRDVTPITQPGDLRYTSKQQSTFFALWSELSKRHGWVEEDRKARIKTTTAGRTDSWAEVTQLEADSLIAELRDLKKGAA